MRSLRERIVHTTFFELIAIAIATPSIGAVTGASPADSGALSVSISVGAVVANYLWTLVFDRWVPTRRRSLGLRALQAAGLEVALAFYTVPLTMWFTGVNLTAALALDAAALVFFLVYGIAYNSVFDTVMRCLARHGAAQDFSR